MGDLPRKARPHRHRKAEDAFAFAVSLVNRKNLGYLFELCAGISSIAGLVEPHADPLGRTFHYQVSRILLDAVLQSTASTEQTALLHHEDLPKLVNNTIDCTDNRPAIQKIRAVNGTPLARLEFIRLLAQLGQVQIAPFEQHPTWVAGRAVALLEKIPTLRRSEIEGRVKGAGRILEFPAHEALGVSIRDAASIYLGILKYYSELWRKVNASLPRIGDRKAAAFIELERLAASAYWSFTVELLADRTGLSQVAIEKFLRLFSRAPIEHREMRWVAGSPYQTGHVSCRLLSVDRYPIVTMPNGRFIVPNITILRNAFFQVLDFSLLDAYRQRELDKLYEQVRGAALEIYLVDLVSDRLPSCVVIPEAAYQSSLGEKRGPDLCILDLADKTLVAIEAKARRLNPATAATATDDALDRNHSPSVAALRKLHEKLHALRTAPEFKSWHVMLSQVSVSREVFVSVVAATLFFHDELEPLRARFDPHHPLAGLQRPFCFLDLAVFEKAVELARSHRIPLAQLLREHYEDAYAGDPNTPAARLFRQRAMPDPSDTFAWCFL